MKVEPKNAATFLKAMPTSIRAALIFGPDGGLVRERIASLGAQVVEDLGDPFRVVEVSGTELKDDPARLADEAASLSLMGGRRLVRIRDAVDNLAGLFEDFLKDPPGDAIILVEAGDLPAKSALRKAFEKSETGAALACYRDEGRDLSQVLRGILSKAALTIDQDAEAYLLRNLGGDRQTSRNELEKLVIYKGEDKTAITLSEAEACIGDTSAQAANAIAMAVASGDLKGLAKSLPRGLQEGMPAPVILRGVGGHFHRLFFISALVAEGESLDNALRQLRPPVFWKDRNAFTGQLRCWRQKELSTALQRLLDAERLSKSSGGAPEVMASDLLYRLCAHAARRARSSQAY